MIRASAEFARALRIARGWTLAQRGVLLAAIHHRVSARTPCPWPDAMARVRREDAVALATEVLVSLARERSEHPKTLTPDARDLLLSRDFPGEAGEVVALVAAAYARAGTRGEILPADLGARVP